MASSHPLATFKKLLDSSEFVFLVFYRGHWCPFCRAYLKELASIAPLIIKHNGTPIIVTAEPEKYLQEMREKTGYGGPAIADTENLLAKELDRRGLVSVAITERAGYEHGMAQPAVLVLKKDGTVLESWAIVPSTMNLGGASDRPSLEEVWANVEAQLGGKQKKHGTYSTTKTFKIILSHLKHTLFG